jgi:hypothetical protein
MPLFCVGNSLAWFPSGSFYWFHPPGVEAKDRRALLNIMERLAERDVRFISLFHAGWDHHTNGRDHERLTYRSQGRDFRLTDVSGRVVKEVLA